jgi:hypothetical protein
LELEIKVVAGIGTPLCGLGEIEEVVGMEKGISLEVDCLKGFAVTGLRER